MHPDDNEEYISLSIQGTDKRYKPIRLTIGKELLWRRTFNRDGSDLLTDNNSNKLDSFFNKKMGYGIKNKSRKSCNHRKSRNHRKSCKSHNHRKSCHNRKSHNHRKSCNNRKSRNHRKIKIRR